MHKSIYLRFTRIYLTILACPCISSRKLAQKYARHHTTFVRTSYRKIINIKNAVKEVGKYTATINLHKEVQVEIPFEVVVE